MKKETEVKTFVVNIACFQVEVKARTQKEANYKAARKIDKMLGIK